MLDSIADRASFDRTGNAVELIEMQQRQHPSFDVREGRSDAKQSREEEFTQSRAMRWGRESFFLTVWPECDNFVL